MAGKKEKRLAGKKEKRPAGKKENRSDERRNRKRESAFSSSHIVMMAQKRKPLRINSRNITRRRQKMPGVC